MNEGEAASDSDSEFEPTRGGGQRRKKKTGSMTDFVRTTTGRKRGVVSYKESSHSEVSGGEVGEEGGGVEVVEEDGRDGVERVARSRQRVGKSSSEIPVSFTSRHQQVGEWRRQQGR